jgi:hypothetical protein
VIREHNENSGARFRWREWLSAAALCAAAFSLGRYAGLAGIDRAAAVRGDPVALQDSLSDLDRVAQAATWTHALARLEAVETESFFEIFEAAFAAGRRGGLPLELFVERLAALDPLVARKRILEWPASERESALPVLVRAWAERDPQAALDALNQIRDPQIQEPAFPALIEGWSDSGQPGVWAYLASLPVGLDRERGLLALIQRRMQRAGVDAALRDVEQLPATPEGAEFRASALRSAAGLIARSDPARAIALVDAHRAEPEAGLLLRRVAVNWVTQDGAAALDWLVAQPADAQRNRVLREAYRRWIVRSRHAAVAWFSERKDVRGLETIFDLYATALARTDPAKSIAWVESIPDPALRREAMVDVAAVWGHADPAAARPWIDANDLAADLAERTPRRNAQRGTSPPRPN